MAENNKSTASCGCGCLPLILLIFVLWALWFGLPTPWGKYNLDIFPPKIWVMDDDQNIPKED